MCFVLVSWQHNFNFKFYFDITIVLSAQIESLILRLLFINYMYITKRLIIPQLTLTRAVIDRGPIFVEVRLKTKQKTENNHVNHTKNSQILQAEDPAFAI